MQLAAGLVWRGGSAAAAATPPSASPTNGTATARRGEAPRMRVAGPWGGGRWPLSGRLKTLLRLQGLAGLYVCR
jgi:hypothetical protein